MLFNCKLITFNLKQKFCFDTKRLENTSNTSVQQKKPQTVNTKENVSREVHRCTDRCRPQVSLKCIGMSVCVCVIVHTEVCVVLEVRLELKRNVVTLEAFEVFFIKKLIMC